MHGKTEGGVKHFARHKRQVSTINYSPCSNHNNTGTNALLN